MSILSSPCPYTRNYKMYPYFDYKVVNKLRLILSSFAKSQRSTVRFTMFVLPLAWNISVSIERLLVKFNVVDLY